jgi:hypothetical protein
LAAEGGVTGVPRRRDLRSAPSHGRLFVVTALRIALAAILLALVACVSASQRRLERAFANARTAQLAGDWEEAARYAAEAQAELPADETTTSRALLLVGERGRIALQAGRDEEAERFFADLRDRIDRTRPNAPSLAYSLDELAKLKRRRGDREGARSDWERILTLERDGQRARPDERAFAYAGLARLARDAGDGAEADRLFRLAITQDSSTGDAYAEIRGEYGALLRSLGREEDAERVEAGIGAPPRSRHYLWYVTYPRGDLDARDERTVRRWPDEKMPLRVYVPDVPPGAFPGKDPAAVRAAVIAGVEAWRDVVRPGVPSFVVVDAPRGADLRFRWTEGIEDALLGWTAAPLSGPFQPYPIRIAMRWHPRGGAPLAGLQAVVTHETGHALGLWGHSPDRGDLMYHAYFQEYRGGRHALTERDRETLRLLYGLAPGEVVLRTGLP